MDDSLSTIPLFRKNSLTPPHIASPLFSLVMILLFFCRRVTSSNVVAVIFRGFCLLVPFCSQIESYHQPVLLNAFLLIPWQFHKNSGAGRMLSLCTRNRRLGASLGGSMNVVRSHRFFRVFEFRLQEAHSFCSHRRVFFVKSRRMWLCISLQHLCQFIHLN